MIGYTCHRCYTFYASWPGNPCPTCKVPNAIRVGKVDRLQIEAEQGVRPMGAHVQPLTRHSTAISSIDTLLGGGAVDGHAILLVGNPGAGKTTLGLQICAHAPRPLFVSAEQDEGEIAHRAREMGLDPTRILFSADVELGKIEAAVANHRPTDAIIDSLACLWDPTGSQPGTPHAMKNAAQRLRDLAHATKSTLWIVGHVNAKGRASGPMAAVHWVDVLLKFDVEKGPREWRCLHYPVPKKNRGGPTTGEAWFRMTERGLVALPMARQEDGTMAPYAEAAE